MLPTNAQVQLQASQVKGGRSPHLSLDRLSTATFVSMQAHESLGNPPMPNERRREFPRRVLYVNNAPVSGSRRGTGGMKEQRPEGEDGAFHCETYRLGFFGADAIDCVSAQPAEAMRATYDSHWPVVDGTRIEVQANSEHVLENVGGRLNVWHAGLLSPRSIVGHVGAELSCGAP